MILYHFLYIIRINSCYSMYMYTRIRTNTRIYTNTRNYNHFHHIQVHNYRRNSQ
jgi:hypothetical protein